MTLLTPRQQQVLSAIRGYVQAHGFPPSVREIGAALGLRSPASVHRHLEELEQGGRIEWQKGQARTIRILEPEGKSEPQGGVP